MVNKLDKQNDASHSYQVAVKSLLMASSTVVLNEGGELRRCRVTIPLAAKLSKSSFESDLVLKNFALSFHSQDGTANYEILLEDLIGVTVLDKPTGSNKQSCRVIVNVYSRVSPRSAGQLQHRSSKAHPFDFGEKDSFQANLDVALEWKEAVLIECKSAVKNTFVTSTGLLLQISLSLSPINFLQPQFCEHDMYTLPLFLLFTLLHSSKHSIENFGLICYNEHKHPLL